MKSESCFGGQGLTFAELKRKNLTWKAMWSPWQLQGRKGTRKTNVNFLTSLGRNGVGVAVGDWEQGTSLGALSIAWLTSAQA